jgi:hypothetical protein
MPNLNTESGYTVMLAEFDDPPERNLILVRIQPEAFSAYTTYRRHMSRLGHDQPRGTHTELPQMHQMPIIRGSVVRIVLAHG